MYTASNKLLTSFQPFWIRSEVTTYSQVYITVQNKAASFQSIFFEMSFLF